MLAELKEAGESNKTDKEKVRRACSVYTQGDIEGRVLHLLQRERAIAKQEAIVRYTLKLVDKIEADGRILEL